MFKARTTDAGLYVWNGWQSACLAHPRLWVPSPHSVEMLVSHCTPQQRVERCGDQKFRVVVGYIASFRRA